MFESAQDLIAVLLGMVALWFLFGALIKQERLWNDQSLGRRRRRPMAGPPRGGGRTSSR